MNIDPKQYRELLEIFEAELRDQQQELTDELSVLAKMKSARGLSQKIESLFRISHNLKGAARSVELINVAEIAHELEDIFSKWRDKKSLPAKNDIKKCMSLVSEMLRRFENYKHANLQLGLSEDDMLKVPARRIERVDSKLNELSTFQLRLSGWGKSLDTILANFTKLNSDSQEFGNIQKLKLNILNLQDDIVKSTEDFARDIFLLQQDARKTRLISMHQVLQSFKSLVRDVSETLDKSVELEIHGNDVEVDKSVADLLKAPIQHILKNAVAHGIEEKSFRKKNKKPSVAKLEIKVTRNSGQMLLSITDDGQGIAIDKLKNIAFTRGICSKDELANMTIKEAQQLIFYSNISTADSVSEISGRGVGLDAVQVSLEKISGKVEVESVEGEGTTFTLSVPLNYASSRGVLVKAAEQTFVLPSMFMTSLHAIAAQDIKYIRTKRVVYIQNKPIPVVHLLEFVNSEGFQWSADNSYGGILVESATKQVLVLVDEIIEERDCVIKVLPFPFNSIKTYMGVTIRENTGLVLTFNLNHLVESKKFTQLSSQDMAVEKVTNEDSEIEEIVKILIVDDSLTTRTLVMNALTAAGYEAVIAEDGKKASDILKKEQFACVVTDIEMPNMNGFELTSFIKNDDILKHIPVLIVSSKDSAEDKKRGMEAGADGYLFKQDFETSKLVNIVESLL